MVLIGFIQSSQHVILQWHVKTWEFDDFLQKSERFVWKKLPNRLEFDDTLVDNWVTDLATKYSQCSPSWYVKRRFFIIIIYKTKFPYRVDSKFGLVGAEYREVWRSTVEWDFEEIEALKNLIGRVRYDVPFETSSTEIV